MITPPMITPAEAQLLRRLEQLRAECKLLRAVCRQAEDFLENRPGGTCRGLEVTVNVYKAWLAEPNSPRRGARRLRVAAEGRGR
jgi:hypothetical protein